MENNIEGYRGFQQAEFFRLMDQHVRDYAIILLDERGRVMTWSQGAESLMGYREDEMIGRPCDVIYTPEDRRNGVPQHELQEAIATGRGQDDRWHIRKDGSRFWSSGVVTPLRGGDGHVRGFARIMRDLTAIKIAQDIFVQQNSLLDLTPVLVRDLNDRIVRWTMGMQWLYGFTSEEAVGRESHEILRTQFPEPLPAIRSKLMKEGRWYGELTHIRRDGCKVVVVSQWVMQRDEAGKPLAILEVNNDITGQKNLTEALSRQRAELAVIKAHLEAVLNNVQEGILALDSQARIVFCNNSEVRITGFSSAQDMFQNLAYFENFVELTDQSGQVLPLQDWPASRVLRGETITESEYHFRRKDTGQQGEHSFSGSPVLDSEGQQVLSVVVTRDVTEARRADRAIRQSAEDYRQIFELSAVGMCQFNLDGRWRRVNQRLCEIVGYSSSELLSMNLGDITYPEDRDADALLVKRLLTGELETYQMEKRYLRKTGSLVWVNVTVSLVKLASGEPSYFIGVVEDITRRKELEEEVNRNARELQERVDDRTHELQEANAALEAFGYSVSHDLRTPLRNMQSLAQALEEDYSDRLDADGREYCQRIVVAARKMDRLINDLLTFSRLSRIDLPLARVDLNSVLAEVLAGLQETIEPNQANISIQPHIPPVLGHRPTLVQVASNLISNALKFVARGVRPIIDVQAEVRGAFVQLSFRDNGIGIAPEHQERIFKVFERLHGEESYPGTGIGLAIVRKAIERTGGRVGVESQSGQGSHFWLDLPLWGERT